MKTIEQLVPTTPPYTPTRNKTAQRSKVHTTPLPSIHHYNTRASRGHEDATLPRVGQANILYKCTPLNIHEIFPEQPGYKHSTKHQPPRVTQQSTKDPTKSIPIKLKAQWLSNAVIDDTTGAMLEYRHLIKRPEYKDKWEAVMCRELGRLSQGYGNTIGTNTIFFIPRSKVPADRKVTYMTIVCTHKPTKSDPERVRLCVGGDILE